MSIYITHQSDRFNIDSANKFLGDGEKCLTIMKGKVNPTNAQKLFYDIDKILASSRENDMLIIVGNSVISSLCCTSFFKRHKKLNLLIWDATKQEYVKRNIQC